MLPNLMCTPSGVLIDYLDWNKQGQTTIAAVPPAPTFQPDIGASRSHHPFSIRSLTPPVQTS